MVFETGKMVPKSETELLVPDLIASELGTMEGKPIRMDSIKMKSKPIKKDSSVTIVDKDDEGRWSTLTFCIAFFSIVALVAGFLILGVMFGSTEHKGSIGLMVHNRSTTYMGLGFIFFGIIGLSVFGIYVVWQKTGAKRQKYLCKARIIGKKSGLIDV